MNETSCDDDDGDDDDDDDMMVIYKGITFTDHNHSHSHKGLKPVACGPRPEV